MNKKSAACVALVFVTLVFLSCKKKASEEPVVTATPQESGEYVQYGTPFSAVPDTRDIVMYEVNLRAFSNTSNLQGVINRLDQLQAMHINVVWLMPIHPIGEINSVNSPYCVKDYLKVNTEFGTLAQLRTLVSEAHNRGMAVILDWVANHTAWDNPWIAHTDWYSQDGNGNIIHPPGTNWNDVADLNFENTDMRAAMIDAMRYWVLEANVDGYRCDYADGVPFDFWQQAIDTIRTIPNRNIVFLAEGSSADHYTAGFDMNYGWSFYGALQSVWSGQSAAHLITASNTEYAAVPAGKEILRFTTNHDESAWNATPITLFGGQAGATAASVLAIYLRGVPMIYTGQEVGRVATVPFFTNSPIDWSINGAMRTNYQDMLAFYTASPASRYGALTDYSSTDISAFVKTSESEQVLVMTNVRNAYKIYNIPAALEGTVWTNALTNASVTLSGTLTLVPWEYLVLKN